MPQAPQSIDDYALAAFISGKVPGKIREQILESLDDEEEALRLLAIVYQALVAAKVPDDAMRWISKNWKRAA